MSTARDDDANGSEPQAKPLLQVTRRGLLLGGIGLAVAACVRGGGGERAGAGPGVWYIVNTGDSLTSLSRRTGLTVDRLVAVNELDSPVLRPGTRLWIPGLSSVPPELAAYKPPVVRPKPEEKSAATSGGDHYELVPRSAWTSEPVGPNHILMGKVNRITIHHTDEHSGMEGRSDLDVVRMIERYHRGPEKRWAAIGYHYLVGKDGKVYEGRPVKYQGAHCGKNENNLGISAIGDFHHSLPNPKQLRALKAFVDDQCKRFDVVKTQVLGHREIKPTICPGDALFGWVLNYGGRA